MSLNFVSDAYWRWLKNAGATSAKLLRFVKERFNKHASVASAQWRMNIGSWECNNTCRVAPPNIHSL